MSELRPSPASPSDPAGPTGGGKGDGRGEQVRRLRGLIIALVALAAWYALRLLPGDITPEAPETTLRQAAFRGAAPRRLWRQPQPFPTYDPAVAYGLLDHLDQAALSRRRALDADVLRRDLAHLRDQLSSRWLSTSGDWRVAGEGVLTCFSLPAEPDRLAAALRPASGQVARVSAQVRFLTPAQPQERAGLTPGLDSKGSGLAFLVGWSGARTLSCEWVRLEGYRATQALARKELRATGSAADQPTSWLTVALASTAETGTEPGGGWQATVNGTPILTVTAPALPAGHVGILLQSQGTRAAFADFRLNDTPTDSDLAEPLVRLTESLRLADLLALPGDPNSQFRADGERPSAPAGSDAHPVQQVEIAGVAHSALVAPAPSAAEFPLPELSGPCRLQAWVGLYPASWQQRGAFARPDLPQSEVRVRVTLRAPAGEQELWSATFGAEPQGDQHWLKVDVPLPEFAGPVSLNLRAEGSSADGAEVPGGYVVWANPVIRLLAGAKASRNVILVIIDSLRADALGGQARNPTYTPTLDRLAKESVSFENAFAQSPWCVPSLASLYSSLWPEVHGADPPDFRTPGSLSPAAVTLAEALRYAGYHTSLLTDEPYPERVNLEQGFEEVVSTSALGSPVPSALFTQAAGQADGGLDRPFFLCLHTHRLAQTVARVLLEPPMNLDRLREKLRARYFAELTVSDQQLGEFLASLESHGLLEDTLLIVTADHGIDLSDRYPTIIPAGTGFTLRDEQLHVPLLMRAPTGLLAPRQVPAQVRLIDLAPTVCDLLDLACPPDWQGESLAPLLRPSTGSGRGEPAEPRQGTDLADRPVFASACFLPPRRAAVRWRGYKYVRVLNPEEPRGEPFLEPLDNEQLYNISKDPGETENLAAKTPQLLAEMRGFLLEHLEEGARQRLALFPEAAPQPGAEASAEAAEQVSPAPAAKGGERQ